MGSNHVHDIQDGSFDQEVLKHQGLVMVDFWAAWCSPCRLLAPVVDQLAEHFVGKLKVCKMDVDANPSTAETYKIRGIPALLFFQNGEQVDELVGSQFFETLERKVQSLLAGS